jgi:transcription antitermination factor NusG
MYLCYARSGKEFEVTEAMAERGAIPYCAKRMRFIRKGKQRRPEPDIQPYLQNYIFAEIPVDIYLNVMDVKYLASTTHLLSSADVAALERFRHAVDAEYEAQEHKRRNQEAVSEYEPGQALQFLDGRFSDSVVKFRDIVERAHDLHPKVRASVDMMGREVLIEVDPLSVKGA